MTILRKDMFIILWSKSWLQFQNEYRRAEAEDETLAMSIATHSPVVLQEVPLSCAWKLRRSHNIAIAERPTRETFGENIGILTREAFGLEVTRSGFHSLLDEAVAQGGSYNQILDSFGRQLGSEARAIVKALVAVRFTCRRRDNKFKTSASKDVGQAWP